MTSLPAPAPELTIGRQGTYAGAVSRLVAFGADVGVSWGLFTAAGALLTVAIQLFTKRTITITHHQDLTFGALLIWDFIYFTYLWAVSGKTIGMALFGIRVVTREGNLISTRQAAVRTLTLPISIVLLPISILFVLYQKERRCFHDLIAGTVVVYAWDARAARLRWISRAEPTPKQPVT
jgi:uncharacterized RDD family membrane protein YckC